MNPPPVARDFPQLDAIRAVAALAVVLTHTAFWAGMYGRGLVGAGTQRLEVGVAIFFVLSGFLLGRPFLAAAMGHAAFPSIRRYAAKRVLRIVPIYWFTVVAAFVLVGSNDGLGPIRVVQNLLFIDYYRARQLPEGLTQMWSLAVEASFYLLLPFLALLLARLARGRKKPGLILHALLALVGALSIVWVAVTHVSDAEWAFWAARALPSYLTWFVLGLGLGLVSLETERPTRVARAARAVARDRTTCWVGAAALLVLVSTPLGGSPFLVAPTVGEALVRHLAYAGVAVLVVLPAALGPDDTRGASILAHPFVRHVGHISYSLFCCHVIVLYLVVPGLGFTLFDSSWPLLLVVVLGISLVTAELMYRYVERPFLRLKPKSRAVATTTTESASPTAS